MSDRQVSIDGKTRPLGPPFFVLATQNPREFEGTYPLPESQMDRFMIRLSVGPLYLIGRVLLPCAVRVSLICSEIPLMYFLGDET